MNAIHRSEPFQWWARLGYVARGMLYGSIGLFGAWAAVGHGGALTGSKGALRGLLGEPFGRVLLAVVAVSLLGYSAWRLVQAVKDVDHHGTGLLGLVIRGGFLVSGLIYGALALFALQLIWPGTGGKTTQSWAAMLLARPAGQWLVGLIGVAVTGVGLAHLWKGWRRRYRRYLHAPAKYLRWIDPVSRYGLMARGVVFIIIGNFVIVAAYQTDASETRGVAGALHTLEVQPYGTWLLLVVALGLVAFALYSFVEAAFRHLE